MEFVARRRGVPKKVKEMNYNSNNKKRKFLRVKKKLINFFSFAVSKKKRNKDYKKSERDERKKSYKRLAADEIKQPRGRDATRAGFEPSRPCCLSAFQRRFLSISGGKEEDIEALGFEKIRKIYKKAL